MKTRRAQRGRMLALRRERESAVAGGTRLSRKRVDVSLGTGVADTNGDMERTCKIGWHALVLLHAELLLHAGHLGGRERRASGMVLRGPLCPIEEPSSMGASVALALRRHAPLSPLMAPAPPLATFSSSLRIWSIASGPAPAAEACCWWKNLSASSAWVGVAVYERIDEPWDDDGPAWSGPWWSEWSACCCLRSEWSGLDDVEHSAPPIMAANAPDMAVSGWGRSRGEGGARAGVRQAAVSAGCRLSECVSLSAPPATLSRAR